AQLDDLTKVQYEVEPLTYYGVARALKEFKERRNGLGVLATLAARELNGQVEDQFNRTGATTVVDGWHFLDRNKVWVVSGFAAGSLVNGTASRITDIQTSSGHYYQRPDAQSYHLDPTRTSLAGSAARLWLNKEKGNVFSNSAIGFISPGFEVNDLGFQ